MSGANRNSSDQELIEELIERGYTVLPQRASVNLGSYQTTPCHMIELYAGNQEEFRANLRRVVISRTCESLKLNPDRYLTVDMVVGDDHGIPVETVTATLKVLLDQSQLDEDALFRSYVIAEARDAVTKRSLR